MVYVTCIFQMFAFVLVGCAPNSDEFYGCHLLFYGGKIIGDFHRETFLICVYKLARCLIDVICVIQVLRKSGNLMDDSFPGQTFNGGGGRRGGERRQDEEKGNALRKSISRPVIS